jgi:ABC-type methionine transport system ATPase subunit
MMKVSVKLWYEDSLIQEPVLAQLVDRFHVIPNIRRANVEDDLGWILCDVVGVEASVRAAFDWLQSIGIEVETVMKDRGV